MMEHSNKYRNSTRQSIEKVVMTIGVLLVLSLVANAQKKEFVPEIELTTASNTTNYKLPGKQFYPTYVPRGSEFYDDEWTTGSVVLENGDVYKNLYLKYNTLHDEVIYLNQNTNRLISIDKDAVSEFVFDKTIKTSPRFKKMFFDKLPKGDRYFEMLYEGRLQLVIHNRTLEEKTSAYKDRNGYLQVSDFVLRRHHYVCFPDGDFEKVKLRRRSLLTLFPEKKKEIRKLLRQNKNSFRTNKDAVQAIRLIEENYYSE